ncbi:hypothetical protein ASG43_01115 [Aureimonas sp. Leaf454]|uniref:hypothetical protein n=1 Tax=Aureimonas sp. Leaf454 TaxID=1736381 RepID=UPI0006FFE90A|nr:hypothetical protein [Aureimonas sp. Leaf454]KQT54255.1 hypothetical protein ASG43_01115 [Aureimonas sp. Leaf454]
MAKVAKRARLRAASGTLLADRLLALFGFELGVLERAVEPLRADADEGERDFGVGAKARIEALGQMVRTLEKLLELKQLEALASGAGAEGPDAEAERLAAELMRRLRVLDRRRRAAGLPTTLTGEAGEGAGNAPVGRSEASGATAAAGATAGADEPVPAPAASFDALPI